MGNNYITVKEDDLKEILNYQAKNLVGKICKRMEIFGSNIQAIKADSKELIYESHRDLEGLIYASSRGLQITTFKFEENKKGDLHSTK